MSGLKQEYQVWDLKVRWFHWINVLCVFSLMILGTIILQSKALGVSGEGKVLLKTVHVFVGYAFITNLVLRLVWLVIGKGFTGWRKVLPFGKGYVNELKLYISSMKATPRPYLGRNPLSKLVVSLFLLMLSVQAITGLVIAGTDIYFPPLGSTMQEWVVAEGSTVDQVVAGSKEHVDAERYKEMRAFRKPFITTHYYLFFVLLGFVVLHIAGVVITDVRESNSLISAMFTGKKVFSDKPVDIDDSQEE